MENLTFRYPGADTDALKGISLSIEEGEFAAIIGRNGSGKSTLARLLNGLLQPSGGSVTVAGMSAGEKSNLFAIRREVGVVFQNPDNQLVASVVEDDVAFGPENIGMPREEIGKAIDFALDAVGMQEYRKSTPTRLSGGQKQRVAIAGVLAIKPRVLVLDESTAMLDPRGRKEVMDVVKKLNRENGMTLINITHYMDEVCEADRAIVLDGGRIAMSGTPAEIFSRAEELEKRGLDVPVPTAVAAALARRGVDIGMVYTKEELGEKLCAYLSKI